MSLQVPCSQVVCSDGSGCADHSLPIGCSTHWSNIHHTLLHALPDESIIHFNHTVTDFQQPEGSRKVQVTAEVGDEKETKSFEGDLLVAADGSMSLVRSKFRPQDKRRYCICFEGGSRALLAHQDFSKMNATTEFTKQLRLMLGLTIIPCKHVNFLLESR